VTAPWLLYGATGRTGTLIAEEAVARGHHPVLAGRDPEALRLLADRLGVPWVAGPVEDLARLIGDARLVLLTAGPFQTTAPPVLRACLDAGVHYLDIANEIPVASAVLAADDAARTRGATVLPAVGFGTVASDGLARHVVDQLPDAIRLELAILGTTDGASAGARASRMAALAAGGRVRRDGRLVRVTLGTGARRRDTPIGERTLVPVPTADLVVTGHTTGVPNISVSMPVGMPPAAARIAMPALPLLARASVKSRRPARQPHPNGAPADAASFLWARATAADGRTVQAWARTGEGYAFTARAAILAVEATLWDEPHGATTAACAFGPELSFAAGVELITSVET
jgi:short subunit dehydrogenase-like uncharacterized protein